jgi:hypothetical protein
MNNVIAAMLAQNSIVASIAAINLHDTCTDIKPPNLQGLRASLGYLPGCFLKQ